MDITKIKTGNGVIVEIMYNLKETIYHTEQDVPKKDKQEESIEGSNTL